MTLSSDEDDVPLASLVQRKRLKATPSKARSKTRKSVALEARNPARQLCEMGERHVMEFLAMVPDRLRVEAVCTRWRALSRELPITELDFGQVAAKSTLRREVMLMLERADSKLQRLVLPDVSLVDENVVVVLQQQALRALRAHRMQKKHVFNILQHCAKMTTLELLDCRALTLSGWPRGAAPLREVYLNGCNFITKQAVCALVRVCGTALEKLTLTEATSLDSQILRDLASHSERLEELTLSHCSSVRLQDLRVLAEALSSSLRWIDFSSCRGVSDFPDSVALPRLEVLILDKTKINDDGLRAIARVAISLRYLSLQDCRAISDDGIAAIASAAASQGCSSLEVIDLKGTAVTDASVQALETQCSKLHLIRVDSCRSVSRQIRHKHYECAQALLSGNKLSKLEQVYVERKKIEMIDPMKSDSDSSDESTSDSDAVADCVVVFRRTGAKKKRRR